MPWLSLWEGVAPARAAVLASRRTVVDDLTGWTEELGTRVAALVVPHVTRTMAALPSKRRRMPAGTPARTCRLALGRVLARWLVSSAGSRPGR